MSFCTVINCMDGRVQLPVNRFMQQRFNTEHVDTITEAGPNLILSKQKNRERTRSILEQLKISIQNHNSVGIAIVGHHDCAGNPAHKDEQIIQLQEAVQFLQKQYKGIEVIGLWVCDKWGVQEITKHNGSRRQPIPSDSWKSHLK